MQVDRIGDSFVARLTDEDAKAIYSQMALRKMMGNLVGNFDPLERLGLLVAIAVKKSRSADQKKSKKPTKRG